MYSALWLIKCNMEAISVSICMSFSCQPPTHSFPKIQKLKDCSFYWMQRRSQKSRETWGHRKTTKKHCIFNKPYQICSNLIACKPCSEHGICILNTGVINGDQIEACANVHVHPILTSVSKGHVIADLNMMPGKSHARVWHVSNCRWKTRVRCLQKVTWDVN